MQQTQRRMATQTMSPEVRERLLAFDDASQWRRARQQDVAPQTASRQRRIKLNSHRRRRRRDNKELPDVAQQEEEEGAQEKRSAQEVFYSKSSISSDRHSEDQNNQSQSQESEPSRSNQAKVVAAVRLTGTHRERSKRSTNRNQEAPPQPPSAQKKFTEENLEEFSKRAQESNNNNDQLATSRITETQPNLQRETPLKPKTSDINNNNQASQVVSVTQPASKRQPSPPNQEPPLIHTDQLNTTTRLLFVYPPKQTNQARRHKQSILVGDHDAHHRGATTEFNHHHQRQQQLRVPTRSEIQRQGRRQHWRDSQGSASLTMAASELEADELAQMSPGDSHDTPSQLMIPRLEVLNLEVTSSSATLTWALSLVSADSLERESPSSAAPSRRSLAPQQGASLAGTTTRSEPEVDPLKLSQELKTLRSISLRRRRDTNSVRAGNGDGEQDAEADAIKTPTTKTSDGGANEGGELEFEFDRTTTTERPQEDRTTDLLDDILRNFGTTTQATDATPTSTAIGTTSTTSTTHRPAAQRNLVEALPASSVGPTKRPPNRARKPSQVQAGSPANLTLALARPVQAQVPPPTGRVAENATTFSSNGTRRPQVIMLNTTSELARLPSATTTDLRTFTKNTNTTTLPTVKASVGEGTSTGSVKQATVSPVVPVTSTSISVSVQTTTKRPVATTTTNSTSERPAMMTFLIRQASSTRARQQPETTRASKSIKSFELEPEASTFNHDIPKIDNSTHASQSTTTSTSTTITTTTTMRPIQVVDAAQSLSSTLRPASPAVGQQETTTASRKPTTGGSGLTSDILPKIPATPTPQIVEFSSAPTEAAPSSVNATQSLSGAQKFGARLGDKTTVTPTTNIDTPTTNSTISSRASSTTTSAAPHVISMRKSQMVTSESLQKTTEALERGAADHITPTSSTTAQPKLPEKSGEPSLRQLSSKWLVRLRRFGSNEVEIVKVIISDLERLVRQSQSADDAPPSQPPSIVRSISFKNLDPSSGYEICVESASPNQLIGDKFHILNANHFLKCHDISDVELSNINNNSSQLSGPGESLRRMDLRLESSSSSLPEDVLGSQLDQLAAPAAASNLKMKSLCREFFTLASSGSSTSTTAAQVKFGGTPAQTNKSTSQNQTDTLDVHNAPRRPKSLIDEQQLQQQKPLGAGGALRSHMELMEISALSERQPSGNASSKVPSVFEMFASPVARGQQVSSSPPPSVVLFLSELGSGSSSPSSPIGANESAPYGISVANKSLQNINTSGNRSSNGHYGAAGSKLFGDGTHIVPIVGCVFVLIFLATIANMLLNLLHCDAPPGGGGSRSSGDSAADMLASHAGGGGRLSRHLAGHREQRRRRRRRRQRLTDALTGRTSLGGGGGATSPVHEHGLSATPTLLASPRGGGGHFLSSSLTGSDRSVTSNSRIVIVGKNGEPFGSAAGYFDVPPERVAPPLLGHISPSYGSGSAAHQRRRNSPSSPTSGNLRHKSATAHGDAALQRNNSSSVYLLSSALSPFPLGPSFEGDEKHNADMVGLARRNYDNFINNIYNADNSTSELLADGQLNSGRQTIDAAGLLASPRRQLHAHSKLAGHHSHVGSQSMCSADNQYQQVVVSSTPRPLSADDGEQAPAPAAVSATSNKLRLRFDKVNPIYNMDGIQQHQHYHHQHDSSASSPQSRMSQQLGSFGQQQQQQVLRRDDADSQCSLCDQSCDQSHKSSVSSRVSGASAAGNGSVSGLDKQKQRFHAQQAQLERVVSKSGSLVPQPFINVSSERVGPDAGELVSHAYHSQNTPTHGELSDISMGQQNTDKQQQPDEFMFGDYSPGDTPTSHLNNPEKPNQSYQESSQEAVPRAPTPPPPPPPAPLSATNSPVPAGTDDNNGDADNQKKAIVKETTRPLVNMHAIGSRQAAPGTSETIERSDFNQRRSELASKLHLPGMTKE